MQNQFLQAAPEPVDIPPGYFSHSSETYKLEKKVLALKTDTDADGKGISIEIKETSYRPYDYDETDYYNKGNETRERLALLINNQIFKNPMDNRDGSDIDFNNMKILLEKLGYHVTAKENREATEMLQDVKNFASLCCQKRSNLHSCVAVVMSHGDLEESWAAMKYIWIKRFS